MPRNINGATESTCTLCLETLPIEAFYKVPTRDSITSRCMKCVKRVQLERYHAKRASGELTSRMVRDTALQRRYGITIEEYEAMKEAQNYSCKICGRLAETLKKDLHVDHCHKTGKVRDLLCPTCNRLVGIYEKNPSTFTAVMEYVASHE